MNKILQVLLCFAMFFITSFANANEVDSSFNNAETPCVVSLDENVLQTKEKTLQEKLADIYHLEVEKTDKPNFLLTEILTKKFDEKSAWDNLHLWGGYVGHTDFLFSEDEFKNAEYRFDAINVGLDGKLKNNNGDFRIWYSGFYYTLYTNCVFHA